jgi:hypothetical protein
LRCGERNILQTLLGDLVEDWSAFLEADAENRTAKPERNGRDVLLAQQALPLAWKGCLGEACKNKRFCPEPEGMT